MGLISTSTALITPEATAFHEVDTSISMLFTNTAPAFFKAGTPLVNSGGNIMAMKEPKGIPAAIGSTTILPTAMLAHDVDYTVANEEVAVGAVTRGVYYSQKIKDGATGLSAEQIAGLEAVGLYGYGVTTN